MFRLTGIRKSDVPGMIGNSRNAWKALQRLDVRSDHTSSSSLLGTSLGEDMGVVTSRREYTANPSDSRSVFTLFPTGLGHLTSSKKSSKEGAGYGGLPPTDSSGGGVFRADEAEDVRLLVDSFTAPALATALRNRETTLQTAASLAAREDWSSLKRLLEPFSAVNVEKRRIRHNAIDLTTPFGRQELVILQRYLHRLPRHVYHATASRASVLLPIVNNNGVPSVLFERRSGHMRTHRHQVCFPGGMVDEGIDATIVATCLRELEEELGISRDAVDVLGVLRCNWTEIAAMTGISVTPVVGFIGDFQSLKLTPNGDEVADVFTVPLSSIVDERNWINSSFSTPMFTGGPYKIWGLTAYLLRKLVTDVLVKCVSVAPSQNV